MAVNSLNEALLLAEHDEAASVEALSRLVLPWNRIKFPASDPGQPDSKEPDYFPHNGFYPSYSPRIYRKSAFDEMQEPFKANLVPDPAGKYLSGSYFKTEAILKKFGSFANSKFLTLIIGKMPLDVIKIDLGDIDIEANPGVTSKLLYSPLAYIMAFGFGESQDYRNYISAARAFKPDSPILYFMNGKPNAHKIMVPETHLALFNP
jgi:hypothetical protein